MSEQPENPPQPEQPEQPDHGPVRTQGETDVDDAIGTTDDPQ